MKKIFVSILATVLFSNCSNSQNISIFEEYDFNSGNYKLYGIVTKMDGTGFVENVGDFVIEDTVTLNKIKQDWKLCPTDKARPHNYMYSIRLAENDSNVFYFDINLDYEYLTCKKGGFEFPADLLNKYENSVVKISGKNVIKIYLDANNQIFINDTLIDITNFRSKIKKNLNIHSEGVEYPEKHFENIPYFGVIQKNKCAMIKLGNSRKTLYRFYIQIQEELNQAIHELRDEFCMERFGIVFADCSQEVQTSVKKIYPFTISETVSEE